MKPEIAVKQVVREKMQAIGLTRADRPTASTIRSKAAALDSMRSIRMRAAYQPDEDRAHADIDLVHEVEGALSAVEPDIHEATACVNRARTPAERRSAELGLVNLMAQKRRLQFQLAQAKVRQLNNVGRTTLSPL